MKKSRLKPSPLTSSRLFLAIEDRRFFTHFGIDPFGVARAIYSNILGKNSLQGASTLTQQLAKNFLISSERFDHSNRSFSRKIQEVLLSFWLEMTFSKEEILMMYLNRSYFGSGALGIDGAAQKYFGKSAATLNLAEGAVLAGLLKAPSKYSPHNDPELSWKRANIVLHAMADAGFIPPSDIKVTPPEFQEQSSGTNSARYFFDWILETFPGILKEDIIVKTTLDIRLQKKADQALSNYLKENKVDQGAVIIMDHNGAIRAMVGGKSYKKVLLIG